MSEEDLKQVEEIIKKHKHGDHLGAGVVTFLFLLFLQGCFKGCGY